MRLSIIIPTLGGSLGIAVERGRKSLSFREQDGLRLERAWATPAVKVKKVPP